MLLLLSSSDIKSRRSSILGRFEGGGVNSDTGVGGVGVARSSSLLHHFNLNRGSNVEAMTYTSRSSNAENRLSKDFCNICSGLLLKSHIFRLSSFGLF